MNGPSLTGLLAGALLAFVGCAEPSSDYPGVLIRKRLELTNRPQAVEVSGLSGSHCVGVIAIVGGNELRLQSIKIIAGIDDAHIAVGGYAGTCGDGVPGYRHLMTMSHAGKAMVEIWCDDEDNNHQLVELVVMKSPSQRAL